MIQLQHRSQNQRLSEETLQSQLESEAKLKSELVERNAVLDEEVNQAGRKLRELTEKVNSLQRENETLNNEVDKVYNTYSHTHTDAHTDG